MEKIGSAETYKFDLVDFLDFEKAYDAVDAHTRNMLLSGWILYSIQIKKDGAEYHATYRKGDLG